MIKKHDKCQTPKPAINNRFNGETVVVKHDKSDHFQNFFITPHGIPRVCNEK